MLKDQLGENIDTDMRIIRGFVPVSRPAVQELDVSLIVTNGGIFSVLPKV